MQAARFRVAPAFFLLAASLATTPVSAQQGSIYYSGSVTWAGQWKISNRNTTGSGGDSVTVTIDSGAAYSAVPGPTRVTCSGRGWSIGAAREEWAVTGRGLVDIVTDPDGDTPGAGAYQIRVACGTNGEPARFDHGASVTIDSVTADLTRLEGTQAYDHPQTDEANGVTGTMRVTWRLRKAETRRAGSP